MLRQVLLLSMAGMIECTASVHPNLHCLLHMCSHVASASIVHDGHSSLADNLQAHHPSAIRSDSAGSLLDTCKHLSKFKQEEPGMTCCTASKAAVSLPQQHAIPSGCSSSCCDPLTHSSYSHHCCSITGSSYSSSSPGLKTSRDLALHYGPVGLTATVAAGGDIGVSGTVAAAAVWSPQLDPLQQPQHSATALAPLTAQAVFPGLRVRSSLGTAFDWSTPDSSLACSPRSMLTRMGLSSSGVLARQLMPWASAGSSMLGLGINPHSSQNTGVGDAGSPGQQQQGADVHGSKGLQQSSSTEQQQQGKVPQSVSTNIAGGQQQQQGMKASGNGSNGVSPTDGDAQPQPAVTARHVCSSSNSSTSSSTGAASSSSAGAVAPRQLHSAPVCRSSSRGSSHSSSAAPAEAASSAAAPAAAATSTLSPLALAVAAAVAEHNKKQPRMWTPFALRVHQMRVAQVLLAERQRQVALNQPTPPPPEQPLVPQQGEPVALPDDKPTPQQQQQQGKVVSREPPMTTGQEQQQVEAPPAAAAHEHIASTSASSAEGSDKGPADHHHAPLAAAATAAVVGVTRSSSPAGADAMVRPLVPQMQQQLSLGTAPAGGASSTTVTRSSSSSSSKPPRQPKKKGFLSCFVPRTYE